MLGMATVTGPDADHSSPERVLEPEPDDDAGRDAAAFDDDVAFDGGDAALGDVTPAVAPAVAEEDVASSATGEIGETGSAELDWR